MAFAFVSLVWAIHAFVTRNWFIAGATVLFTTAYASIVVLWFKYRVRAA